VREIKHIVVHCTATAQTATVEQIKERWQAQGWSAPGYHVIVLPSGGYARLATDDQVCNGVRGRNQSSLHVSYIGGVDKFGKAVDNRTARQKETLIQIIKAWKAKYPQAKVLGHRDFSPDKNGNGRVDPTERLKECPCFDAIPEYERIS
jgi:N-acetylmuramoyl-L-alanine amidase